MKKVLIVTYHFPPEGGPAVQRVSKFVKYLPKFGYEPIVLTSAPHTKTMDSTLLNDIPESTIIKRTKDWGLSIPGDIRKKLMQNVFIPDKFALWKNSATKAGIKLVQEHNIDLIFSTSPPHSVQLVAQTIAQKTGIPWITDFRDEWTAYPTFHKLDKKNQAIQHEQEKNVLEKCNHVVTVTDTFGDNFKQKLSYKKISIIRNGFDSNDFKGIEKRSQKTSKITFTYCGRLNQLHSPIPLFKGLSQLLHEQSELQQKLEFTFIGNIENQKYLHDFPELKSNVNFLPYQTHKECIQSMADSSALLLLATNMNNTEFIPAKVYEYMFLNKPICAVLSFKGELERILQEYDNSYVALENDIDSVKSMLKNFIEKNKKSSPDASNYIKQFDRKNLTQKLAKLFDTLLEEDIRGM